MTADVAARLPSVLIANRGEIACRIIRTARALGMRTIAVHSDADAGAPHVRMADEAHAIGPAPARESYLVAEKIIAVAKAAGAACIHPGYGFLSENADFADACAAAGILFVGPPASAIRAMGLKDAAKALAEKAGVPVVPGYHGQRQEPGFLAAEAAGIGYPVLIKAIAGGGGKGMKRVDRAEDFTDALESAQREARSAFGDARVLVEKYILSPRHIEMQVFADAHGNVVHLFERDCSLQRRHQKVIEEAPAPGMTDSVRAAMGKAAVEAARAVGYVGAGTVEFIADGRDGLKPDGFFFMEMNTRLQVEHPVTEAITGLDLVALQFRVAAGGKLPFAQGDLKIDGHAVEARVYAEDPENGFLPSTGKLWALRLPEGDGLRVDSGVVEGGEVTPHYDPMIAKVVAHAPTREAALAALASALGRTVVAGPRSNVAFLKALCEAPDFRAGHFDTGFIERNLVALGAVKQAPDAVAVAAAAQAIDRAQRRDRKPAGAWSDDPWAVDDAFDLAGERSYALKLMVDDAPIDAIFPSAPDGGLATPAIVETDAGWIVVRNGRQTRVSLFDPFSVDLDEADGDAVVKSPMHGKLIALFVKPDEHVMKGQRLAIVEAMKMEHALVAPRAGIVAEISAATGQQVAQGAKLIALRADYGSVANAAR
jgi:3-methylcrotonyl-CoA carboxylase alpha subunit